MTVGYVASKNGSLAMPNAAFAELMKAVLDRGAPFRFEAAGFSMSPFIRSGDVITLAPPPVRFRRGDVAAFISPRTGKLTVHRLICVSGRGILIKGDNSSSFDGRAEPSALIGRVIRIEHRGRRVKLGLGPERAGIAFLSKRGWLIPLVRTIRLLIRPFRRHQRRQEKEKDGEILDLSR